MPAGRARPGRARPGCPSRTPSTRRWWRRPRPAFGDGSGRRDVRARSAGGWSRPSPATRCSDPDADLRRPAAPAGHRAGALRRRRSRRPAEGRRPVGRGRPRPGPDRAGRRRRPDVPGVAARRRRRVAARAAARGRRRLRARRAPAHHAALFDGRLTRPLQLATADSGSSPTRASRRRPRPTSQRRRRPARRRPRRRSASRPTPAERRRRREPAADALELLRRLVAERAELPLGAGRRRTAGSLDDLHLSSITVGQIVSQVARRARPAAAQAPTDFATATVRRAGRGAGRAGRAPRRRRRREPAGGVGRRRRRWVPRLRASTWTPPAAAASGRGRRPDGPLAGVRAAGHPLAERAARRRCERAGVGGGVLLVPAARTAGERHLALRSRRPRRRARRPAGPRFVLVADRAAARPGWPRRCTWRRRSLRTTVVHLPPPAGRGGPGRRRRGRRGRAPPTGFSEVHYDARRHAAGCRCCGRCPVEPAAAAPRWTATTCCWSPAAARASPPSARWRWPARPAPRSRCSAAPTRRRTPSWPATCERMSRGRRRRCRYARADVTDADAGARPRSASSPRELGPVTAVLHGAGRNEPGRAGRPRRGRRSGAPWRRRSTGCDAVLAAVDPDGCGCWSRFGCIIGRAGLRGEARLRDRQRVADRPDRPSSASSYPHCRACRLEWSVWSGVGMGERLGGASRRSPARASRRSRPDEGVARAAAAARRPGRAAGRGGHRAAPAACRRSRCERPSCRCCASSSGRGCTTRASSWSPRPSCPPGTDPTWPTTCSTATCCSRRCSGWRRWRRSPAALTGRHRRAGRRGRRVPAADRGAAGRRDHDPGRGAGRPTTGRGRRGRSAAARPASQADHFRARLPLRPAPRPPTGRRPGTGRSCRRCRSTRPRPLRRHPLPGRPVPAAASATAELAARHVRRGDRDRSAGAVVRRVPARPTCVLGDPGARDAVMHGIQVLRPGRDAAAGRRRAAAPGRPDGSRRPASCVLRARERSRDGDTYVYDLDVRDERRRGWSSAGRACGCGRSASRTARGPWPPPLLGPYLERRSEDLLGRSRCAVRGATPTARRDGRGAGRRRRRRQTAAAAWPLALGSDRWCRLPARTAGPEVDAATAADLGRRTAPASPSRSSARRRRSAATCEAVAARPADADWRGLLGAGRRRAGRAGRRGARRGPGRRRDPGVGRGGVPAQGRPAPAPR